MLSHTGSTPYPYPYPYRIRIRIRIRMWPQTRTEEHKVCAARSLLLALFARPSPHCLRLGLAWRALSSDASAHRAVWVRRLHRADMCGLAVSTNVGAWVAQWLVA